MSGSPDVERLRALIAAAAAEERKNRRLETYLRDLGDRKTRPTADAVRAAIEITPELISEVAEKGGPYVYQPRIREILDAAVDYWEKRAPDNAPGASGFPELISAALLTMELLERLEKWYFDQTGGRLIETPLAPHLAPHLAPLRAAVPEQERVHVATLAEKYWSGGGPGGPPSPAPVLPKLRLLQNAELEKTAGAGRPAWGAQPLTARCPVQPPDAHLYDVWYATNRKPANGGFGTERDDAVHYGVCSVEIPRTHEFGSVGTAWWKRWLRLQFTDDRLRIVHRVDSASEDQFFKNLGAELAALSEQERQILFYLHGYNVSFEEAAIRAAQIGFDLKTPGITAFFSWPSKASVDAYFADADRIASSEQQITDFLVRLAAEAGGGDVHIIAHSMGNRGLARAIQRITISASRIANIRFGQILLAAPDIEGTLFRDLARIYPQISRRTTMYVSARDRALGMSKWLQDSTRAGFTPPVTVVPQIDTIEVTNIDLTMLGHGYYAEAEAVLYDMKELLEHNSPPDRRIRLAAAGSGDSAYWVIGK